MFQQDMEASNREWRHQNGENRSWNDSEWQIESPPVPHFRTDPSYLHPVLSGSQRSIDPAFLRRDSMKSDTTYARVEDILEVRGNIRTGDFFFACDIQKLVPETIKSLNLK